MKRIWIALLVLWPMVGHADTPCANSHFMKVADPTLTRQACHELSHAVFEPRNLHANPPVPEDKEVTVFHIGTSDHPSNEQEHTALGEVQGAVEAWKRAAVQVRMPMPDKIMVVLDPNEIPPTEGLSTLLSERDAWIGGVESKKHDCILGYHYKSADPRKLFVLAHQLFHCIVIETFETPRLGAGDAAWWAEGSAEFFASIVSPTLGTAQDAATFRAHESIALTDRGADAVVFFDWYCTQAGRLKGLIDMVNDKPPGAAMVDLVDEVGGNHWLEFEEAYYDHSIMTPHGSPVYAETPLPQTEPVNSSTTKNYRANPFVIRGTVLEFAKDKSYDLDGGEENDFHWKWAEGIAGGGWEDMPRTVHTCHEKKKYRVIFSAKNREVNKRLRITAHDEREADCPCVVGSWAQTGASLARVAGRLQARGIRNSSCTIDGGGTTLTFTSDHHGGETYNGMHTSCTSPQASSQGTTNGTRAFDWADTSTTQLTFSSAAGGNAISHIVVTAHGHTSEVNAPMTGQGAGAVNFRCTRTDLHLDYGTEAFDYTRVGSGSGS